MTEQKPEVLPSEAVFFIWGFLLAALLFSVSLVLIERSRRLRRSTLEEAVSMRQQRIQAMLNSRIDRFRPQPLSILLFGPSRPSPDASQSIEGRIWSKREEVRSALASEQCFVVYGEELESIGRNELERRFNPLLKEKILAGDVDLIVVFAASIGSATELGAFSQYPVLCWKMLIAVHEDHTQGFLVRGAVREASANGAHVITVTEDDLVSCRVKSKVWLRTLDEYERRLSLLVSRDLIGGIT